MLAHVIIGDTAGRSAALRQIQMKFIIEIQLILVPHSLYVKWIQLQCLVPIFTYLFS